jgi:hypothetical protein
MDPDTNISAAIARSRRIRQAQRTRRRRIALAACACALGGFPLSLSLFGVSSSDMVHAAAAGAESLSDLLNQRSPGERTAARLTKTKHARTLAKRAARPAARHVAEPANFDKIATLLEAPPIDVAPSFADIAATFPEPGIVSLPGVGGGGGGGGEVTPPGGGGGTVTIPTQEPQTPPIPVTPLPEPETWATMLLGFGLLGWRVRRHPKTGAKTATA